MSSATVLFQCYDGPGPIPGQNVSWMMARDALHQDQIASARNGQGLIDTTTAPVRTIQEVALRAPSFDFSPVILGGGSVLDGA